MATPNRNEIRLKATETFHETNNHLPTITPTDNELKESGLWFEARNSLMSNTAKNEAITYLEKQALELGFRLIPTHEYEGTSPKVHEGLLCDLEELEKSNVLISGTNATGKSRMAMQLCSTLHKLGWQIITFDNSGIWKTVSDIPYYYTVKPQEWFYQIPTLKQESIIYDISDLLPQRQKDLVDSYLMNYWNNRTNQNYIWTLICLEELELYARSIRGFQSQNLYRICHVGRNRQTRTLGITTDCSLLDTSFIRLCQQRYHGRLGIEENSRRKFKNTYGKKWTTITENLKLGEFVYLNKNTLQKIKIPLFQSTIKPLDINELSVSSSHKKGLIARLKEVFK